jgi:Spy/CpxP family protein refolding chaperone
MKTRTLMALLLCGAGLILLPAANAQVETTANADAVAPPPRGPRPSLTERLTRSLALNETQKAQVQILAEAVQPQLEAIHQQAREAEGEAIKQLNEQIRPLLTAEQQTKLDALEADRAQRFAGPPPR